MIRKLLYIITIVLVVSFASIECEASQFFADDEEIIIVIDPGHGGENAGTIANENFSEKEITLKTANALLEELEKYDGVTVYSTRTDDVELSLKERAEFAASVNADFLISLHYNASEYHTLFGAEVWIPLKEPYHAPAYQFAYLQLREMQEMGLFIRGIKTRSNEKGSDYYGIIREAAARDIPAVIIEHAHVDEERDSTFCNSDEVYVELGKRDAQAIVKFLGLEENNSSFLPQSLQTLDIKETVADTFLDLTPPDVCMIETENIDYENGLLTIQVTATDYDTPLMYYDYSLDGGVTYSKLQPWPGNNMLTGAYDDVFSLLLEIPDQTIPKVVFRAYNKFDICKKSNSLIGFKTFSHPQQEIVEELGISTENMLADITVNIASDTIVSNKKEEAFEETVSLEPVENNGLSLDVKRLLLLTVFAVFWILMLLGASLGVMRFLERTNTEKNKKHIKKYCK